MPALATNTEYLHSDDTLCCYYLQPRYSTTITAPAPPHPYFEFELIIILAIH